jgi:hypothetical protein
MKTVVFDEGLGCIKTPALRGLSKLFNAAICGMYSIADGAEDLLQSWKAALLCQS